MGLDLTGIGSVADFATGVLDRFWPPKMDEKDRMALQAGLIEAMEKREVARDAIKGEVIKAEMSQGDKFTKRARPSIVYAGLGFIFLVHVFFPMLAWYTAMFSDDPITPPILSLPQDFWWVWGGVCSVWMIGRTMERNNTNDVVGFITGSKK